MRTFDQWMNEYGVSHKNHTNQMIHKVCVPLIMLSVVGLLWAIPSPDAFSVVHYLNWATLFVAGVLIFYLTLSFKMFIAMVLQSIFACWICIKLEEAGILIPFCVIVFFLSWAAQFYGHKIEGKKPSFLQDLAFLLIGPLWVTRFFYKKIGINA
ncbi:MAG TPA: Mpo1-like protein [Bacteriovoracaceae bacterium]|nr:Mpo1-like protein [Bacteriovoracaceae bacterium]